MKISKDMRGNLPEVPDAARWVGTDSRRTGWKLTLPGHRPLATPAVIDGTVFLGGGFGSYDFYAFDAFSGELKWQYQTEDDGPTAAVVCENFVAFNTESCELEVLTTSGERVWKKWLGDPLMSMPAIANGRVFQVYPDSRKDRRHYLGAFDLRSGKQLWKQLLTGEIITAPVLADDCVYLTNLDGTISCFRQDSGEKQWQEEKQATSSPVVCNGECYFSRRKEVLMPKQGYGVAQQMEGLARRSSGVAGVTETLAGTVDKADYLDHAKRKLGSPYFAACEAMDGTVGFGAHKGDAKMEQAQFHLGHGHVSSLWAYQGSKPFYSDGRLYSAVGDTLHSLDPGTENPYWKQRLYDRKDEDEVLDNVITPPAVVNGKLFVGTIRGEVCCLEAESGELLWREKVDEAVVFQPAVVAGRVYIGTTEGSLICIETGDPDDDGWNMWGANASHNGVV